MRPFAGWSCKALGVAWLTAALHGCAPEANPQRVQCFQGCARMKDGCILRATSAEAIGVCDRESAACGSRCPE